MRRIVMITIGVGLLVAACLKGRELTGVLPPAFDWWADARFRLLIVEWELVLGTWLLSGHKPVAAWLSASVTFAAFAIFSGSLWIQGVPTCGCFGAVDAGPQWSFAVDVLALLLLGVWRPTLAGIGRTVRAEVGSIAPLAVVGGVLALGLLSWSWTPALAPDGVAHLRGEKVTLYPAVVDVGSGDPLQLYDRLISIRNRADVPVRVYGATRGCDFDLLGDCPVTIEANASAELRVRYRLPGVPGQSIRRAAFWVMCGNEQFDVPLTFKGNTVPNDGSGM